MSAANDHAFLRLTTSEPVLLDVRPALEVVPDFASNMVLTSGAPLPWDEYVGGQRRAIIFAAIYEGLADDEADADRKLRTGAIELSTCHPHSCVGSVAGVYTASMPVFVVRDEAHGNLAFCNLYEGESRRRLNYGTYDDTVQRGLDHLRELIGPTLGDAARRLGGVPLKPIMQRAINMGDELHSRNTAATLLFTRELLPVIIKMAGEDERPVRELVRFLNDSEYFFLRLSMASCKAAADAAHGIEGSTLVTAMTISCRDFAIRVSGLGDTWFRGPHPKIDAKLFEPFTEDDIAWMGGESCIAETAGLGGFAQAAAFSLQAYQGGTPAAMVETNQRMYDITYGEHPVFRIPYLAYRGTPTGIDVMKVAATGTTPVIDAGIAGRDGGQIGAGLLHAPIGPFVAAAHQIGGVGDTATLR